MARFQIVMRIVAAFALAVALSFQTASATPTITLSSDSHGQFYSVSNFNSATGNGLTNFQLYTTGALVGKVTSIMFDGQQMVGSKDIYDDIQGTPGIFFYSSSTQFSYRTGSNFIDISLEQPATATQPLDATLHYILRDGESGYHTYLTYHHTAAMADYPSSENRYAEFFNDSLFHYSSINDNYWGYQAAGIPQRAQGRFTTAETSDMKGIPGEYTKAYETKYDWRDTHLSEGGVTGIVTAANTSAATGPLVATNYGVWNITDYRTNESWNAGPLHPQSPWADGASFIVTPAASHQGGPGLTYTGNMDKAFAPQFTYFNKLTGPGNTVNALRADATKYTTGPSAADLNAFYDSLNLPYYATAAQRGTVSGKIRLADGSSMDGATVILSTFNPAQYAADPISQEQQRRADGYNYWVSPSKDGTFTLPDVRPGTYRVTIFKPGNYREGTFDNIVVTAGNTTNTGNLTWQPDIGGKGVLQVGTFDRTSAEFKRGNEYNNWKDTFSTLKDFPNGINYTVNPTNPFNDTQNWANNWGLDQLNDSQDPWKVNFNMPSLPASGSTVTVTFALAAQSFINRLNIKLNNTTVTSNFDHTADNASVVLRSGDTSGRVMYRKVTFPSSALISGNNIISFDIGAGGGGGELQWDAIRMDITGPGSLSVAQWNGGSGNWTDATQWRTQPYGFTAINKSPGAAILEDTSTTFADGATQTAPINGSGATPNLYDAIINGGSVNLNTSAQVQKLGLLEGTLTTNSGTALTVNDVLTLGGGTITGGGTISGQSTTTVNFANTISGGAKVLSVGTVNWTDGGTMTVTGANSQWNAAAFSFGQGGPSALSITNGGQVIAGITAGGTVTIGSQGSLTLDNGKLTTAGINNAGTFTSTNPVSLTINGGTFANSGTANISGGLAGTGASGVVNNAGTMFLGGTNTYTGATTVNGGLVQFAAATSMGSNGGKTVLVNAGGAVSFVPGIADATFLGRMDSSSTGALALTAVDSATPLDFTSGALGGLYNMAIGAVGNVTYTGVYTPTNGYHLGGGGGTLTFAPLITGASVTIGNTGSSGTVILDDANSYAAITTIKGGVLSVDLLGNGGVNSPIGSSSSAAGNLILDGGTLSASANVSTNRLFTIGPGGATLDGSAGAMVWTATSALANAGNGNRTLTLTGTNSGNSFSALLTDPIGGVSSLTKTGSGTWTITSSDHNYSGDTTVLAGTLKMGSFGRLPFGSGKGNLVVALGATFEMNGAEIATNALNDGPAPADGPGPNGNGGGTIDNNSATVHNLNIGNSNTNGQFSGIISGNLNLVKNGTGTQILSGDSTYTGTTTINSGTLQIGVGGTPISTGPGDGGFRGKLGVGNIINNATLVFNRGYMTTCTNVISGPGTLKQIANAELVLGSANTYTGPTVIGGGIANIGLGSGTQNGLAYTGDSAINASVLANGGVASSIGASSNAASNLVLDGGTLYYSSTTARSTDRLFTVTQNGGAIYTSGALTFSNTGGPIVMSGTGDRTLSLGGDSIAASTFNPDLGDPANGKTSLTKDRSATWILSSSAAVTYSGDTTLLMGKLQLGAGAALPFGAGKGNVVFGTSTDFGSDFPAVLELNGNDSNMNGLSGGLAPYSSVDNNTGGIKTLTLGNGSANATFDGLITGSLNLVKTGNGTQILTGANTYTGSTTTSGGTLQFGNATASGSPGTGAIVNNAALVFNRTDAYSQAASNTISGTGSLNQAGTGTLILTVANTFSGDTTISAGTLQLANSLALQNSTLNHTGSATSFSFGTLTAATLGGLKGTQALPLTNTAATNVALTVGNNGQNTTYSGILSGGGSLIKVGAGTLILAGANTYTGTTQINQGVLQLGAANRINNVSNLVLAGGTLATGSFSETLGTLGVNAISAIDFGAGSTASVLQFADSHTNTWAGMLAVNHWSGRWGPTATGMVGKLLVGNTASALSAAQLSAIDFTGYAPGAVQLPTGEVLPIAPMKGDFNLDHTLSSLDLDSMLAALVDPVGFAAQKQITAGDLVSLGDFDADNTLTNADIQGEISTLLQALHAPPIDGPELSSPAFDGLQLPGANIAAATVNLPTSVPEPASILLAALAGAALFRIKRGSR